MGQEEQEGAGKRRRQAKGMLSSVAHELNLQSADLGTMLIPPSTVTCR